MKKPNQSNFQENVDQMWIKQLVFSILSVALEIQLFKIFMRVHAQSLQLCQTLCNPMDCSSPSSSVNGILQVRILKWVAISFSRESFQPRDRIHISYFFRIGRRVIYQSPSGKPDWASKLFHISVQILVKLVKICSEPCSLYVFNGLGIIPVIFKDLKNSDDM